MKIFSVTGHQKETTGFSLLHCKIDEFSAWSC